MFAECVFAIMLLAVYQIRYSLHLGVGEVYEDKVNDFLKLKSYHWIAKFHLGHQDYAPAISSTRGTM